VFYLREEAIGAALINIPVLWCSFSNSGLRRQLLNGIVLDCEFNRSLQPCS